MKRSLNVTVEPAPDEMPMDEVFVATTFPLNVMFAFAGTVIVV